MNLLFFIFAIGLAWWFQRALIQFPQRIALQLYHDVKHIYPLTISPEEFIKGSKLPPQQYKWSSHFYWLFPLIFIFSDIDLPIKGIFILLIYLSLLDFYYYLSELKYLLAIFFLSVTELTYYGNENILPHLWSLFFTLQIFLILIPLVSLVLQKEILGWGDGILFIALSLLFSFEQMILLLLFSSLFGLAYAFGYFLWKKKQIPRLPFIPFITLSTFTAFIVKIPPSF
ncbi:hypothetical protein A4G19_07945 [Pasteurellaceae bacterium Macca]|nr:hypothetical protein [Pasteurellaceae bacterium Macca]